MKKPSLEIILEEAYRKGASDIHIKADENIFYRIRGDLIKTDYYMTRENLFIFLERFLDKSEEKSLHRMDDINKTRTIDGIRIRYNIYLSRGSPSMAIRIIDDRIIPLENLDIFLEIKDLIKELNGLILITGISGSGKTMTMNSIVDYINRHYSYHILMIEDPIEYLHTIDRSLINQREVLTDTRGYFDGLRSSLRQDPDIIFIGEMRTLETIQIALTAAETGHLVFSTLHTMGSSKTIDRIIDVFPNDQQNQIRLQLSTVLKGVFSQNLVKTEDGRKAIFDKLLVNNAVRNLIRENKTYQIDNISRNKFKEEGGRNIF